MAGMDTGRDGNDGESGDDNRAGESGTGADEAGNDADEASNGAGGSDDGAGGSDDGAGEPSDTADEAADRSDDGLHGVDGTDSRWKTNVEGLEVTKRTPTSRLGRLWDRPRVLTAVVIFVFAVLPAAVFVGLGYLTGSLWLPGAQNGLFEDMIFLSYFPVSVVGILGVRYALERQYETLNSLPRRGLLRFASESSATSPAYDSTLTKADARRMFTFCELLLATATFRGADGPDCPDEYRSVHRNVRRLAMVLAGGGFLALVVGTYYHWNATAVYGADIWASANYPAAFVARFVYEAVLYVVVLPLVLTQLFVSLFLVYHPLKRLEETHGIQFRRFAPDEAGGFSRFGAQSFTNVLALMPLSISMGIYALFYTTTPLIVASLVLFTVAVPTIFLLQLWRAHRAMATMQELELDVLGEALTENYHHYKERLADADSIADIDDDALVVQGEALEKADIVYNGVRKQPTWPFGRTQIGQLLSLMTFLVGILVSLL